MSFSMQGAWTVQVLSKDAAFPQRFQITGSDTADGTYAGETSTSALFVTGVQWSITVQHQPSPGVWRDNAVRLGSPVTTGGVLRFDVRTNDSGGDTDYNDLVLRCSMPVSASEFVVYGNVSTYSGPCIFNPCNSFFHVIESTAALKAALAVPAYAAVLAKLYPDRIRIPRIPLPDPPPDVFTPLVIPSGAPGMAEGFEFRSNRLPAKDIAHAESKTPVVDAVTQQASAVKKLAASVHPVVSNGAISAGLQFLDRSELTAVASAVDKLRVRFFCDSNPAPGLLLRFQEYDRTESEKLGGAYTGTGPRENLGLTVTDELGNYLFRSSRSLSDFAAEAADMAAGEVFTTQIRPDVIAQVIGTGSVVDFETAPNFNIPNLRRVDLCIPAGSVHPSGGCNGDRVFQRIGDIIVLNGALGGHPNTLTSDGVITCRNANAPQVTCAAWRGALRLYCCFGNPAVVSYSIRYRRGGLDTTDQFVNEPFALNHAPTFSGTPIGSSLRSVHVGGGALQTVPTYENHEGDLSWIENDLKIILSSGLYRPVNNPGTVTFTIEGYDAAGSFVAGTRDHISLFIDNKPATGDISSITMGTTTLDECALFELTDPAAPLTVRYRVRDEEGYLQAFGLSVSRGNNHGVSVTVQSGVLPKDAAAAPNSCNFQGTADATVTEGLADIDGYVSTTLVPAPAGAHWLPADHNFCAFAFTLTGTDRVTDGRNAFPLAFVWQDLIGISSAS